MRRLIQDTFAEPDDPGALHGEPLVIHLRSEPTRNRAIVIFVHGLGGNRYGRGATWGFFPQFVFEDFPDVDVGLYEYVTFLRRLKFWESIQLSKEAIVLADLIRDVTPYEAVILVGHSMGGLLCEAAIASLVNTAQEQAIQKTRAMILMATPQTGSQRVPSVLRFFSKDASALRPHGEFVTSLQRTLTNRLWLYETGNPPQKQYPIPVWAVLGSSDFWVDQLSAGIGLPDSQTKTVRGSHTQIVKPDSKQHDGYDFVRGCIGKVFARYSATTEGQRRAEGRNVAVRTPAERIPAVGIFFDRREILARFLEFLNDQTRKLVVIAGLPGIGKTAFAAKASHECPLHFKGVFWMTCSSERSTVDVLFGQLHSFLERHGDESLRGLWNASAPDLLPAKIDALVEALNQNPYLLIFDEFASWLDEQLQVKNPDLRRVLHGLICSAHQSKILLISERKPFFDPQSSPIPPGVTQNEELFGLEEADGISLLKQYLPYEDENLLRRIVRTCGANPRMLNWFGYLVARGRQDAKILLASEGIELSRKLLASSVEDLTRESQEALERLAVFRRPLTKQDLDQLHVSFQKAVVPLLDRSLATWYSQDNSVSLAEPVKAFVRARLAPERRRGLHLEAVGFYTAKKPAAQPSAFRDVLPVLEKAYHLAEIGQGQESADALLGVCKPLTEWGYLDLVQAEVSRVLETIKPDPLRRACCLWTLADIHDLRSQYPEALNLFQESMREFETVQNYEGVARCRWRVGRVRNALGDLSSALEDFQACIGICDERKVTGPKAAALLDQGWTLAQQGGRDQALVLMERSLELAANSDDFETQISANRQIGWILWDYRRESQNARECYRRSLEIATRRGLLKELGAVHGDLGYLLTQWGDTQAAEESCRTAIKIREALGDQYGLASAYLNLGLVFRTRKAPAEENRCYEESLAIYRRLKIPGGEADVLLRQAIAWRERAQFGESEKTLEQALGIIRNHDLKLTLADVQHELGRTLLLAGRNEEARTWLARAVEEADRIKSPRAAEYAQFLRTASISPG
jgi:tetratricopeptide (TPR) repeat protein/pimeloyl-ACP methyl ester carboxylesterase